MDWLTKVFGKLGLGNSKSTLVGVADPDLDQEHPGIPRDLFVDETPPIQETLAAVTAHSSVTLFLEKDFFRMGCDDGYGTHSADTLGINQRRIRAEFRFAIEQLIDDTKQELLLLKSHLIEAGGIAETLRDQLQLRIDELNARVNYLQREKEISVEDEGLVSVPIHKYHDGFVRGVQSYEEEKIFASSTGLFT